MNGFLNKYIATKNSPKRAISNHDPMLEVLATLPSGNSSDYRFLYAHYTQEDDKVNVNMWISNCSYL